VLLSSLVLSGSVFAATPVDWVRPDVSTNEQVWGIRGGLLWSVAPAGFRGGEPRGLIRLGSPILAGGGYDLVNFIAIEPIVRGRRGFSELERSQLDGVPGKRIWAENEAGVLTTNLLPDSARQRPNGEEVLEVTLRVEPFENGAHVRLVVRQRSSHPDQIEFGVFHEPDSKPMEYCILTATMGNMARTRQLWLADKMVISLQLYHDYKDTGFASHQQYVLPQLHRTADGGVLVAVTCDEADPAKVYPFAGSEHWHYAGGKVTQYWAKSPGTFQDDLAVMVNGRCTYWRSTQPIPGGVAFENFELREGYREGQKSIFGITRQTPRELGFTAGSR
jgi:hypothetical protein